MATFSTTAAMGQVFKSRSQILIAYGAVALAAAAAIIAAWVAVSLLVTPAAPATVNSASTLEQYHQHVLRENAAAPAFESYPDFGQRHRPATTDE